MRRLSDAWCLDTFAADKVMTPHSVYFNGVCTHVASVRVWPLLGARTPAAGGAEFRNFDFGLWQQVHSRREALRRRLTDELRCARVQWRHGGTTRLRARRWCRWRYIFPHSNSPEHHATTLASPAPHRGPALVLLVGQPICTMRRARVAMEP